MEKTAMIQLRDKLDAIARDSNTPIDYGLACENIIKDIDAQMLKIEWDQIVTAFVAGDERGTGELPFSGEQYYTQTYIK